MVIALTIQEAVRRNPYARVFFLFALGILLGLYIDLSNIALYALRLCAIAACMALLFSQIFIKFISARLSSILIYPSFVLLGLLSLAYRLPVHQSAPLDGQATQLLIGIVVDEPVVREKTIRFPVDIIQGQFDKDRFAVSGSIMVSVARTEAENPFKYGDKVAMVNKIQRIPAAYNPHQFDYRRYCANRNIYHQAFLRQGECLILKTQQANWVVGNALKLRHKLKAKFAEVVLDEQSLSVCAALIFGHRSDFGSEVLQTFSETGTIHVLSVSGMHVSLVFLLLSVLLSGLKRYRYGRLFRCIFMLLAIWAYVILTGMAPSILRAGMMISFLLIADTAKRNYGNLNALFASAFFLLLFDPFLLFDVGFQLSYAAVFGLFTLYPLLRSLVRVQWLPFRLCLELIWVSIAAQLFTAPFALYYFHQFPTYFLLGNLLIAIPSTLLMYLGILLAISPFVTLNLFLGKCLTFLCLTMLKGLHLIQAMPISVIHHIHLHKVDLLLSVVLLFMLLWVCYGLKKSALFVFLSCAFVLSVSRALQRLQYQDFQGIKMYNVPREIAIAVIDAGRVALISTLDSLEHPRIKHALWPDLCIYADKSNISFHRIDASTGKISVIETAFGRIAFVHQFYEPLFLEEPSWVLVRNVNIADTAAFRLINPRRTVIFDGTNDAATISSITQTDAFAHLQYYILKDNFAYVWEKHD